MPGIDSLSEGAIETITNGGQVDAPVLQILGFKLLQSDKSERYRLLISDGKHMNSMAMLATQLNHMVTDDGPTKLTNFCIVRVDRYVTNAIRGEKRLFIILELTLLTPGEEVGRRIGNPVNFGSDSKSAVTPQADNPQPSSMSRSIAPPSHSSSSMFGETKKATPSASASRNSDMAANALSGPTHPISSLTPYQNKWTVRARVTNKSGIRTYSNSRGEGKLFSVDFTDESGEIRATGFNDACDKLYDLLELGKVYYISRCSLKSARKEYNNLKNDYEMYFNSDTAIIPCHDAADDVPSVQYNFVPISSLPSYLEKPGLHDVIGVCKSAGDVQNITVRSTNRETSKRDLTLVDKSGHEVILTLWGEEALKFDPAAQPIVACKGLRLSTFNGCSASSVSSTLIQINPDIPEAHTLRGWYDNVGCQMETQSISTQRGAGGAGGMGGNWLTLGEAKVDQLGSQQTDYYNCKASVVMIKKENCMYMACPNGDCNKKVIDQNNGLYRCEKCNKEFANYKWRLMLQMNIADFTDSAWVTCFHDVAETVLGVSAGDLGHLRDSDPTAFNQVLDDAHFKSFIFRLQVKLENYNDEMRLRTRVFSATPIDHAQYAKRLEEELKKLGIM